MVTTQTADNVLKSYYLDVVGDQLNYSVNPLLAQIQRTTADVLGRDVRKLVRYGVSGGVGAGSEDGELPEACGNNYAEFVTTLKNLYGTVEISDKAIRASAGSEGAFVNLLNDEMDGLVKSSAFNFGRMLYGDGSGLLATILSGQENVYTVESVKNLEVGMNVDLYTPLGTLAVSGRITDVDRDKKTFTFGGGSLTPCIGATVYVHGSKGHEITGLGAIFSKSDSLYGLKRSANPWLNPLVKTSVGDISETVLQTVLDELEEKAGSKVNFIVCSWGVRRALIEALSAYRSLEPMELAGGFRALSYNGIPIVADRFCPANTMYLLNTEDFALHQLCDWQWLEGEDGKILKQIPGKPVYSATLVKYAELMCYRPAGQAMLFGVTEK